MSETRRRTRGDVPEPDELLGLLGTARSPAELVQALASVTAQAAPAETLAWLVSRWQPLLDRGISAIKAELTGYEYLGDLRRHLEDGDDLGEVLATLVEDVGEHGGPAALAMLRVLAVTAPPPEVRDAAGAAADRLAAAGLADPAWVEGLGAPTVGACFGYEDVIGGQEAAALTFGYRRKRHSISLLIDYGLGGGVKAAPGSEAGGLGSGLRDDERW